MVTNFNPKAQLDKIFLLIAQEAGFSSGRVYVSAILTKMAILNNLLYAAGKQAQALEKISDHITRLAYKGVEKLRAITEFRCAIADMMRNIEEHWESANHSRNTINKNLKWLEKIGVIEMNPDKEKPVLSKVKNSKGEIETTFLSPDKQFLNFNLDAVLEAYQALEQLLMQYLDIQYPRRKGKPFKTPDHAGMIARLLYEKVLNKVYRAFSKLPDDLNGLTAGVSLQIKLGLAQESIESAIAQIREQKRIGGATAERVIPELGKEILKHRKTVAQLKRMDAFAELPY